MGAQRTKTTTTSSILSSIPWMHKGFASGVEYSSKEGKDCLDFLLYVKLFSSNILRGQESGFYHGGERNLKKDEEKSLKESRKERIAVKRNDCTEAIGLN